MSSWLYFVYYNHEKKNVSCAKLPVSFSGKRLKKVAQIGGIRCITQKWGNPKKSPPKFATLSCEYIELYSNNPHLSHYWKVRSFPPGHLPQRLHPM